MDRSELIVLGIRMAASAAVAIYLTRFLVKYLDPSAANKKENQAKVSKILQNLGVTEPVELNEHELRVALQLVESNEEGVDWEQIGGQDELINELQERVILPLQLAYENHNPLLAPPRGVLLYGPPGCGKTLLAKAVAKGAGCKFINLQVDQLSDKWYGESQKLTAAVFSVAQKFQPVIIFLDEIDSFLRDRQTTDHETSAQVKAQFMTLWDGFASSTDRVIVMGATNRPQDVDAAIMRRMPARFHVGLPNAQQREQIFKVILKEEPLEDGIDFSEVIKLSEDLSGSDLKEVCRLAVLARFKMTLNSGGSIHSRQKLHTDDLVSAVRKFTGKMEERLD